MKINDKNLRFNRFAMIVTFSIGISVAYIVSSWWKPDRLEFDLLYYVGIGFVTHSILFRFVKRDKHGD